MQTNKIMESDAFQKCAAFHGHICPGLSIGFKAAEAALENLAAARSADEEVVAIVETDACAVDAIQVMTGCTFGKGNFIYKDFGKMAFTLFSRKTGQGVRLCLRPEAHPGDETHQALRKKVMAGTADHQEKQQFSELHREISLAILDTAADDLFTIYDVHIEPPAKAKIEPSETCARCGEPTMRTKLELIDNKNICRGCLEQRR